MFTVGFFLGGGQYYKRWVMSIASPPLISPYALLVSSFSSEVASITGFFSFKFLLSAWSNIWSRSRRRRGRQFRQGGAALGQEECHYEAMFAVLLLSLIFYYLENSTVDPFFLCVYVHLLRLKVSLKGAFVLVHPRSKLSPIHPPSIFIEHSCFCNSKINSYHYTQHTKSTQGKVSAYEK